MPNKILPSVLLFPLLALPLFAVDPAPDSFVLTDYLNRTWSNECVEFPLSAAQAADVAAGKALAGPDGQPVPFQVVTGAPARVAFLVDLAPFETRAYRFTNATPAMQADLQIEETGEVIRLSNRLAGISIRKKLEAGQGPIEKIRLRSGTWVGASRLDLAATGYSVQVVSQGPVFAEAVCRAEFGEGSHWELRLRLNANEPVVLVDETMTLGGKSGVFSLSLSDDFAPDKVFYRDGKNAIGQNIVSDIQPGNVFTLEPWLRWWGQPAEGPVFSVYKDAGTDLLAVGAGEAGLWVDPAMPAENRAPPHGVAVQDGQGLHLDFMLRNGKRKWMVMALDKAAGLSVMNGQTYPYPTPLPHQLVIKHGQFPLDTVKDYVLEWSGVETNHPSLLITRAQADAFRASVTNPATYESQIPGFLAEATPLNQHTMGGRIRAYMATGSRDLEQKLTDQAVAMLQQSVETFLTQPDVPFGSAPHHHWGQFMGATPQLIDAILGGASITPEQRRRILAQLAFIGYTLNRPDYWSPERGYSGNPNMTTSVLGYRMAYACVIPSHPKAREWAADATAGLQEQLVGWSDSNGGWVEAPHYAMVSYDPILASFLMAYRAGMNELVFDPQMKKVINWFSKITTPPDSRAQNRRHLPPVGNTYIGEPTGEFGLLAFIWKDRDPAFAAEMQWMFRRQGSWPGAGLGGSYPGFAGYREMMLDPSIPETAPPFASELFPNVGVMLRSGLTTERETQLLLLAGSFGGWRSHWDDDSGSFTLWGKGRIVADDFGYYGAAPIEDHSLLDAPEIGLNRVFNVTAFAPSGYYDYVSGARGPWQRQIAFVKDPDPLAPQFFVVADTYSDNSANDWYDGRTATHATLGGRGATALVPPARSGERVTGGRPDVDSGVSREASPGTQATIHYAVPAGTPGVTSTPPYATWGTALTNLHEIYDNPAVMADGDIVYLTNGVYYLDSPFNTPKMNTQYRGFSGNPANVVLTTTGAGFSGVSVMANGQTFADMTFSNFSFTTGGGQGGGMANTCKDITISNCVFTHNTAKVGGGICNSGGGLKVLNCMFNNNSSVGAGIGGAMFSYAGLPGDGPTIANCTFSGNSCDGQFGGGLALRGAATARVDHCIFSNNTYTALSMAGGGFNDSPLRMSKCLFVTNSAGTGAGGGWCIQNSDTVIEDCDFINNLSGAGGGLAFGTFGHTEGQNGNGGTVKNCRFIGNRSSGGGGGLSFWYGKGGVVTNCVISDNVAAQGGGVETYPGGGELRNCLITGNRSTGPGGGINVSSAWTGYDTLIDSCTIVSNTTAGQGAGIMVSRYHLGGFVVTNSIVCFNKAKTDAPAATSRLWLTAARVTVAAHQALVEGKDDVDTDIFFAAPAGLALKTEDKTRISGAGIGPDGKTGATTQIGLIASVPAEGTLLSVIYPRLKTEKQPVFTALAGGKGVKVQSGAGTDYVFISATPFTFAEDSITFSGKSGSIRIRGNQMVLSLGEGGRIGAHGKTLESEKAETKEETL